MDRCRPHRSAGDPGRTLEIERRDRRSPSTWPTCAVWRLSPRARGPARPGRGPGPQIAVSRPISRALIAPASRSRATAASVPAPWRRPSSISWPAVTPTRPPIEPRSWLRVVMATRQPSPTAPIRSASGIGRAVEEDLVEVGVAVHLPQRPDFDPGRVHAQGKGGDAGVLGHREVGAGQQQAPIGVVGPAAPHLGSGDPPDVAVAARPGT